jgi:hypothetical protein
MFDIRTGIVHDMDEVTISDDKLFSLADNTLNFLEAAIFIVELQFRKEVIDRIQSNRFPNT